MYARLLCAAATLSAATACAAGSRSPGTTGLTPDPAAGALGAALPPAARQSGGAGGGEIVRLGPSAMRYVVHQKIHVEQQFQGQTQTIDRGIHLFVSATITGPADSVGYPLTLRIDSIVPDSGSALPPTVNLAQARGLWYVGRLAPTGEFRGAVPSDSTLAQTFAQIIGAFRNFYPRLPPAGLTLGAEWTDTVKTSDRTAVDVTATSINHARAVGWEERSGTRCLRLEVRSTYTVAGVGEQGGQVLEVTGTGTRAAVQFLAVDGRYLGGEAHDSSAITINLPVQGMTVPVRQLSHSTVTILP